MEWSKGKWVDGLAEWTEDDTAFLSIAFSWKIGEAYQKAIWWRELGYKVRAGGPGLFTRPKELADVAELGGSLPNAVRRHNPMATTASRGCPVGCWFCIVPAMEGREFTLMPDFEPRPVLTDNNLSALPPEFQQHIIDRYVKYEVPLLDANSGFEPKTFDGDVYERWSKINKGPWRFALDETGELEDASRAINMLRQRGVPSKRIQVYVMIGHEPFNQCMERIQRVIALGGEPYVQPVMKLNALHREVWVRHDWTKRLLRQVQRWTNRRIWRYAEFSDYSASYKSQKLPDTTQQSLFEAH